MKTIALLTILLLTAACSGRPETPDYFTRVTGLKLCPGATIRNINAKSPDRSPGFDSIYIVDVTMPPACEADFLKGVSQRIGTTCDVSHTCSGNSLNNDFYRVERVGQTLRITHAT